MSDDVLKQQWFVVQSPWLPPDTEPYIVAGSPDPQAGTAICDTFAVDEWDSDPESPNGYHAQMNQRWAIAEHICAVHNAAVAALEKGS